MMAYWISCEVALEQPVETVVIDVEGIVDWLVDGARGSSTSQEILTKLAEDMVACGVPLSRVALFVRTLHPNIMGRSFYWNHDEPGIKVTKVPYSLLDSDMYKSSPVFQVRQNSEEIRRVLWSQDCPEDLPLMTELKAEGFTDYIMLPLKFIDGQVHAVSWMTRQADGFTQAHVQAIRRIVPPLARLTEVMALRRVATNLLDAYLGHQSGAKVLAGKIQRGDGEDIHAVIWFCDLRGSTPLADSMNRAEFLKLLNDYFECMAGAVLDGGGEVLRFIGDAALAIFPAGQTPAENSKACEMAVNAVKDAMQRMTALNIERKTSGEQELEYGIGLHLGDVMYGNIGTPTRIEFSVIGAAANEAARIESLCKALGQNFLLSGDVVEHLDGNWASLGHHALRGVGDEVEVFTLA
jgi:adenylate cyclase